MKTQLHAPKNKAKTNIEPERAVDLKRMNIAQGVIIHPDLTSKENKVFRLEVTDINVSKLSTKFVWLETLPPIVVQEENGINILYVVTLNYSSRREIDYACWSFAFQRCFCKCRSCII